MNKIFITFALVVLLLGGAYALNVNYFYSPNCPHCKNIKPTIEYLYTKYNYHNWNLLDTSKQSHNIPGVPFMQIGSVSLSGSKEIPLYAEKYLNCNPNIQPQSVCINGQKTTFATPNHQRPCSAEILFGGKP